MVIAASKVLDAGPLGRPHLRECLVLQRNLYGLSYSTRLMLTVLRSESTSGLA